MAQTDIKINVTQAVADIFGQTAKIPFTEIFGFGANAGYTNNKTVDVVTYKAGKASAQNRNAINWSSTGLASNVVDAVTLDKALLEIVNLQTNASPEFVLQMGRASVETIGRGLENYLIASLSGTSLTSAASAVNTLSGFQTMVGQAKKRVGDLYNYALLLDSDNYATLRANTVAGVSTPEYWNDGTPFGVRVFESLELNDLGIKGLFFHKSVLSWAAGVEKGFATNGVTAEVAVAPKSGVPMVAYTYPNGADIYAAYGFFVGKTVSSSLNTLAVKLT